MRTSCILIGIVTAGCSSTPSPSTPAGPPAAVDPSPPGATPTAPPGAEPAQPSHHGHVCAAQADCEPDAVCSAVAYAKPFDRMCRVRCSDVAPCPIAGGSSSRLRCEDGLCATSPPGA